MPESPEIIMEGFSVRDYREGDFDAVSKLWLATGLANAKRADKEANITESIRIGGKMLVLEETAAGRVCGSSWMTFDGRRIHMHHFGILPEFQGKGLADLLLEESLKYVREKGYQVKLEVHRSNLKAISLYKKYGFEYLGDYDVYIIRDIRKT